MGKFIKSKTANIVIGAMKKIFKSGRIPIKLQTDGGCEFNNKTFQAYVKWHGIHYFTTRNETKCSVIERFNRTLKQRM